MKLIDNAGDLTSDETRPKQNNWKFIYFLLLLLLLVRLGLCVYNAIYVYYTPIEVFINVGVLFACKCCVYVRVIVLYRMDCLCQSFNSTCDLCIFFCYFECKLIWLMILYIILMHYLYLQTNTSCINIAAVRFVVSTESAKGSNLK